MCEEWETAISQPAKQEGVWVQQFPGCVETLWGCPAPEAWTDGFGGAMFTASWLNHWGACHISDQRNWGHNHNLYVCFFVLVIWSVKLSPLLFFSCLPSFSCRTAGHDYKKAIMICLTEHISGSASNQQNEFQSKWREWQITSHSKNRGYVNSPLSLFTVNLSFIQW